MLDGANIVEIPVVLQECVELERDESLDEFIPAQCREFLLDQGQVRLYLVIVDLDRRDPVDELH